MSQAPRPYSLPPSISPPQGVVGPPFHRGVFADWEDIDMPVEHQMPAGTPSIMGRQDVRHLRVGIDNPVVQTRPIQELPDVTYPGQSVPWRIRRGSLNEGL